SAVVAPGGTFAVGLRLEGVPVDGSVEVVIHQRVRSRSELAQSMEGEELRSEAFRRAIALTSLGTDADGTRRLALPLTAAGGPLLRTEGVYPVEVVAQDAAGSPLASLITHLIVPPEEGDDSPPLGVAVVADIGAPPALQPDGTVVVDRTAVASMTELVAGLRAVPDVPATLAIRPETLDALRGSAEPGDAELVASLQESTAGRTVLALPYASASPDALASSDLLDELSRQHERGRAVLTDVLAVEPIGTVAIASPDLGPEGLDVLAFTGVQGVVVADDQVAPLGAGLLRFSLAQPFLLADPTERAPTTVQALATDPILLERLATDGSPGLAVSRVLAELALLRLEQPSVARSVVLPVGGDTSAALLQGILAGIDVGPPFVPVGLDAAFDLATPLLDGGGNQLDRSLLPTTASPIRAAEARSIRDGRAHLDTFAGLLGADQGPIAPLGRHLLLASADSLSSERRRAHVATVETAIDAVASQVSSPATFTLTLTAREGTIPLTIRNGSGQPLNVTVRLRSDKLEFPEGETIDLVLTEESQRIPISVETRSTGAFPLEIDITTPDGERSLSVSRYTVRSTAVSGAGLVLSVGAGVFLVVWWARHWRRTRRSAKLVATNGHPSAGG
ncbi:MAG: DUF6049 family protein, partial [Acidimicrobiales bacterium]